MFHVKQAAASIMYLKYEPFEPLIVSLIIS